MTLKKFLALLLTATTVVAMTGCGGEEAGNTGAENNNAGSANTGSENAGAASGEKQDVALRMWGAEEDQAMLQGMIDTFVAEYADVANITVELGVESESTAKDTVLTDIEAAADVFAFASDQINDLVNAGALQSIDEMDGALKAYANKGVADVKSANAPGSVDAATIDGTLYGFPMSADNGYFLYYDSTKVSAEAAQSWDTLLAAAQAAGSKVGMTFASGWYNASFFYGAGFTTGLNADGTTAIDFNGTADYSGVQVVQAMLDIASHPGFMALSDGGTSAALGANEVCAVVSGTWDAGAAQTAFGDGYAATKLPSYTIDGKQVQQGSVAGFKLVGVNKYSANAGWAALLADWITNEQNQTIRFETREIGPSNINAAASDKVQSNTAIAALAQQSAYGVVQVVSGNYWDPTATFGQMIAEGTLSKDDTAGIQTALDTMVAGVSAPVN